MPYRDSRIMRIGLVAFFLIVVAYAYFEGRALLYGPTIDVSPRVMEVNEPYITIHGTARRIASLSLNGDPIPVTEDGAFEEGYVLVPGYNRIILDAKDKYGKATERVIEIIYVPDSEGVSTRETSE
ncbi:hypothetical protein C4585_01790 [Candidatus Parcubacteria bacterium]|nr:MAG: hypothetical protein C4585_01790 [Candidatus Parcubacteria bacterium]